MYIQITTRCNMTCAHCCFACTKRGRDMSIYTFRKALQAAREYDDSLILGGGEPTVHPRFDQFLLEAMAASQDEEHRVFLVTNGKHRRRALMIAGLTKTGLIDGHLSQDVYHDEIDEDIVEAFQKLGRASHNPSGYAHIRTVRHIIPVGRGRKANPDAERECACEETFVTPNGNIHQCGCRFSPVIGTVETGYNSPCPNECFRSDNFKRESREMQRKQKARLCPVCGQQGTVRSRTGDGRVVMSCGDAVWPSTDSLRRVIVGTVKTAGITPEVDEALRKIGA